MIKTSSRGEGRASFVIGLILVSVGIVCNEWILAQLFSSDGVLELVTRVKIWVFDIALVLIGLALTRFGELKETILRFSQSYPMMLDSMIGVAFAIVVLLCAEGVCDALNHRKEKNIETMWTETLAQDDELLGYKAKPNAQVSAIKKSDGKIVYDVTYSIDEYSRRISPVKNPELGTNSILFFGGSFAFGEGVNDNETMPFHVSELAPHYRPYNYGFCGYGPQQMLAKLQDDEIIKEVKVDEGHKMLIYTFLDAHIGRAIGDMHSSSWTHHTPYYVIDDDEGLVRKGDFTSGRPIVTFLYRRIARSQLVKYFGVNHPRINDDHIRITARIIEESRNAFREKFNSNDFYVLIYPGSRYGQRMIPYFESAGIRYLDYSDLIDPTKKAFHLGESDHHPTAQAHKAVAARLVKDIGILDDGPF